MKKLMMATLFTLALILALSPRALADPAMRPLDDLLEGAYEIYRRGHPWVADYQIAPKSVVREMYEQAMTFAEYVASYGLARAEGIVLRYLADAFKALRQTVPEEARTEELTDLTEWLGELVRQVDSSLIDEWERLREPAAAAAAIVDDKPPAVTGNVRAFRVLVRNALFRRVELAELETREQQTPDGQVDIGFRSQPGFHGRHEGAVFDSAIQVRSGFQRAGHAGLRVGRRLLMHPRQVLLERRLRRDDPDLRRRRRRQRLRLR